mgnify:CR=1 FL=1
MIIAINLSIEHQPNNMSSKNKVKISKNRIKPAIKINNLNVWYDNNLALSNVNLSIPQNQITAFIGPSGCGKTTLLRCLNRMNDLIEICRIEGLVKVDNKNIDNKKQDVISIRKKVGMVYQQPNPFPMSISENMKLTLKENYCKMKKREINKKIMDTLISVNLYDEVKERLYRSALKLSGGQQQRLCIARALVLEPEVILFDEPCSALDPISTMKIEDLLMDLKKKYTIVIVTHNLEQARRIADQVVFFYKGKIIESGSSDDLFSRPSSKLTQDYLRGVF